MVGDAAAENATSGLTNYVRETVNTTVTALASAAFEEAKRRISPNELPAANGQEMEWTGIGLEWLRSLLGKREWTLPCVDVKVRL